MFTKSAPKLGKSPNYVVARLKLTDLVPELAEAFLKNDLTVGHALLIAKLPDGLQKGSSQPSLCECMERRQA